MTAPFQSALTLLRKTTTLGAGEGMRISQAIKRAVRGYVPVRECLARTAVAVAVPTISRWLIDGGAYGAPFLLYFPAIQAISTFLGWRWGVVTAVGSAVASTYFFIAPLLTFLEITSLLALFALTAGPMIVMGHLLRESVLENSERARQNEEFNRELQHRTKNSLQMMRALASQASRATDPTAFYELLAGRLAALAKANELLRFGALSSCEVRHLVHESLAPFAREQVRMQGPSCEVRKEACTPLVMALHELGTNAHKYGALSCSEGSVSVTWKLAEDQDIELTWVEEGGPAVSPPARKGLGSRLIMEQAQFKHASMNYSPSGLTCRLRVAAKE